MSAHPIYLERRPPVAELVLNRPATRNALSQAMWGAIPELVQRAVEDRDVSVLIINGGATGTFASGADIAEFETVYATPEQAALSGETIAAALNAVEQCPKPVLAAIEGACVGGGVSLALAADIRIACEKARFAITPARLGLVYPPGDTRRLLSAVGQARAKDLLFSGRMIPAGEALLIGLVDRVVAGGTALDAAHQMATQISGVSQWSTRAIKSMIAGLQSGWSDDHPDAQSLFLEGFQNVDFKDGHRAFLEKRKPDFRFR